MCCIKYIDKYDTERKWENREELISLLLFLYCLNPGWRQGSDLALLLNLIREISGHQPVCVVFPGSLNKRTV